MMSSVDSEELFRHAFEGANDGMCIVEPSGRLLRVNQQMADMLDYTKAEIVGRMVEEFAAPESVGVSARFIGKSVSGEVESSIFEKTYITKTGRIVYGQVASSLIRNKDNEPVFFISHVRDISARKKIEQERELLIEQLLKALADIKRLEGILPLCSFCKKIRGEGGYWEPVESYIRNHSAADISHGLCPDCLKKHYPEFTD
ncbi:MAG: PAS domain S-box protein [Kiritimatiellae bacterium]|nr:PAS domain S-box protein [Kiritimatiellia bacterium]